MARGVFIATKPKETARGTYRIRYACPTCGQQQQNTRHTDERQRSAELFTEGNRVHLICTKCNTVHHSSEEAPPALLPILAKLPRKGTRPGPDYTYPGMTTEQRYQLEKFIAEPKR